MPDGLFISSSIALLVPVKSPPDELQRPSPSFMINERARQTLDQVVASPRFLGFVCRCAVLFRRESVREAAFEHKLKFL